MNVEPWIVPAGEFKAKCLKLLEEVALSGRTLIVTKRGRPVARITPASEPQVSDLRGSILFEAPDAWDPDPAWDMNRDDGELGSP